MSNVLITGGAGFIGRELVKKLFGNVDSIKILDNLSPQIHGEVPQGLDWLIDEKVVFFRGCVTNRNVLVRVLEGVDIVVHLAAETGTGQSMYEIEHYNHINSTGTAVLLDILTNTKNTVKRIILASSRSVYGEGAYVCPESGRRVYPDMRLAQQLDKHIWEHSSSVCAKPLKPVPTREIDPVKPASIYAATKYAQEDLVRIVCDALGIDYVILRLQNVYGEGQSLNNPYTGILSIFSTKLRRGLCLPIFEDGKETRDFVHVSDVADAFVAAVLSPKTIRSILNVGSGESTSVSEIASVLASSFNLEADLRITSQYRLGDIRHNVADISQLEQVLNCSPKISLLEGMSRFAHWVMSQSLPEDQLDKANQELKRRNLMG